MTDSQSRFDSPADAHDYRASLPNMGRPVVVRHADGSFGLMPSYEAEQAQVQRRASIVVATRDRSGAMRYTSR